MASPSSRSGCQFPFRSSSKRVRTPSFKKPAETRLSLATIGSADGVADGETVCDINGKAAAAHATTNKVFKRISVSPKGLSLLSHSDRQGQLRRFKMPEVQRGALSA
jgi:hypothetical protein